MSLCNHFLAFFIFLNLWTVTISKTTVFIGTGTGGQPGDSKGVYAFDLDEENLVLTPLGLSAETANPIYIVIHPSNKYLYASNGIEHGAVSAFEIESTRTGRLRFINQQSSRGSGACFVTIDKQGHYIFVANYGDGTVAALPINPNDGSLQSATGFDQHTGSSVDPDRQTSPHAHCIVLDQTEQYALSADLGTDQIYQYKFSSNNGTLARAAITKAATPGDGPRHLVFSSNRRFVYVINEIKSQITVFNYTLPMTPLQNISTLPANYTSTNTAAAIVFSPITQKFLYACNRGDDSLVVYSVDEETGLLIHIQRISVQGQTPRDFNITPNGKFLIVANQDSGNLVLFKIDQETGKLIPIQTSVEINQPMCVKYIAE